MERNTRQRTAIREAISSAGRPLLPQEVLAAAQPGAPGLSLADLNLTVSVGPAAVGTFNNVAAVGTTGDTNQGNNTSTDSTTVTPTAQPDLQDREAEALLGEDGEGRRGQRPEIGDLDRGRGVGGGEHPGERVIQPLG